MYGSAVIVAKKGLSVRSVFCHLKRKPWRPFWSIVVDMPVLEEPLDMLCLTGFRVRD